MDINSITERIKNNRYIHALLATVIVGLLFVTFLIVCDIAPFGDNTWLVYDMKRQYADFYSYYRTYFTGNNNIFYSPAMTLGAGGVGFFTYYLSSPFLLLTLLFDKAQIPVAITVMIGAKLSLSAGSCDLFLNHFLSTDIDVEAKEKKTYYRTLLFAVGYALCAYMVSNSVNPMWLDVYMMTPVVIWMLDRLIYKNARIGYILSLAYIIWCNYYIAFMVCLFIAMWTFYRLIILKKESSKKILAVAVCSFWAVALDAVLLLPTVIDLSGSPKDIFQLGLKATKGNLGLRELMSKMWFLAYNRNQTIYGTPLIYAGVVIVILTLLYFCNKKINVKDKLYMLAIMAVFVVSFVFDKINLLWHGGMEPSGYPYREAFLFVFVCIICSCKCMNLFEDGVDLIHILIAGAVAIAMLVYSLTGGYQYISKPMLVANVLLVVILIAAFTVYAFVKGKGRVHRSKATKKLAVLIAAGLILVEVAELFFNATIIYKNQTLMNMTGYSSFSTTVDSTDFLVEQTREEGDFFRMENMSPREQNDDMMYDFNGVTHYSSAGTIYTRYFLQRMGYNDDGLYTNFGSDNTCTADSVLGIKYLVGAGEKRNDYVVVDDSGDGLYRNPYPMSVASIVESKPEDEDLDPFSLQEKMFGDIIGEDPQIFVDAIYWSQLFGEDGSDYRSFTGKAKVDGYIYLYLDGIENMTQNLMIYLNDEFISGYGNLGCLKVLNLGYFEEGDSIDIDVKSDGVHAEFGEAYIVSENMEALEQYYDMAVTRNATVSELSSSKYIMRLPENIELNGKGGLITTIPYEKGWRAYIDGKRVDTEQVYNTFLYIPFEEAESLSNDSEIELVYVPEGIIEGFIISMIAIAGIILLMILDRRKRE